MTTPVWPIVTGTGHRDRHPRPEVERWLRQVLPKTLRRLRDEHGTTTVISGLAWRWDAWLAEDALAAGLELWGYSPGRWQVDKWPAASKVRWERLRAAATRMVYADLGDTYKPRALHERNEMMFRDADLGLTDWRFGKYESGTYGGLKCALRRRKPVVWFGEGAEPPDCRIRMPTLDEWAQLLKNPKSPPRQRNLIVEQGALPI